MDRRRFLALPLGAVLLPGPAAAAPAPEPMHRLAFFTWRGSCGPATIQDSLLAALRKAGWSEGRNLAVQRHCDIAGEDAAPAAARALAASAPELVSVWGAFVVRELQRASIGIPIAAFVDDAVAEGLADEYRKPRGNVTGVCLRHPDWERKSLEYFRKLVPRLKRLAIVGEGPPGSNPTSLMRGVDRAARDAGIETIVRKAPAGDFGRLFSELSRDGIRAAYLWTLKTEESGPLVELATQQRIATLTLYPEGVEAGCLMGYMVVNNKADDRMAAIIDKMLRGMTPALIPWELPDEPVLAINLKTAKRLGIVVPPEILIPANQVVQ